jgi:hypothetical protein
MDKIQFAGAASMSDPHNYKQALKSDDSEHWKEATLTEYNTLIQNGTWEIVDLPPGEKAIGKIIHPSYIPTAEQVADILTTALPATKVQFCREQMGIYP